jgi:hypothetical protein
MGREVKMALTAMLPSKADKMSALRPFGDIPHAWP